MGTRPACPLCTKDGAPKIQRPVRDSNHLRTNKAVHPHPAHEFRGCNAFAVSQKVGEFLTQRFGSPTIFVGSLTPRVSPLALCCHEVSVGAQVDLPGKKIRPATATMGRENAMAASRGFFLRASRRVDKEWPPAGWARAMCGMVFVRKAAITAASIKGYSI